jgi:hypothetical protein
MRAAVVGVCVTMPFLAWPSLALSKVPKGTIQSVSQSVCLSVCLSVCSQLHQLDMG